MAIRNSSIKYNFVMLSLCSSLNQLFLQCSRRFHPQECSLRAKIHHSTPKGRVFIDFHLMELVGEKEYVIDGVVIDKQGFQLIVLNVPEADSFGVMANFFSWVFARQKRCASLFFVIILSLMLQIFTAFQ